IENKISAIKNSQKNIEKENKLKAKKKASLEKQVTNLENKIEKLDQEKKTDKILLLKNKINNLKSDIEKLGNNSDKDNVIENRKIKKLNYKIDDLKYTIKNQDSLLKSESDEYDTLNFSLAERKNIKMNEHKMKLGAKILSIIFAVFLFITAILLPTVGPNLDKSFSDSVVYTI